MFIDRLKESDLKHLIQTAKKCKCESLILISRCGFTEKEKNKNIRLLQDSGYLIEKNLSIRNTFNKIREDLK